MAYVYAAHTGCVTIFSTDSKSRLVSELHTLALSCLFLCALVGCCTLSSCNKVWPVSWGDIFRCRCLHVRANRLWVAILICPSISVFLAAVVWILIHSDSLKVERRRRAGVPNSSLATPGWFFLHLWDDCEWARSYDILQQMVRIWRNSHYVMMM